MRRRGHTLLEVLVATVLMALILSSVYAMWSLIANNSTRQETRMQVRDTARNLMADLSTWLQSASYVWVGTQTQPALLVDGTPYTVPPVSPIMSATASALVFAVPETLVQGVPTAGPLNLQTQYSVFLAFSIHRKPSDPQNPGAFSIELDTYNDVVPVTPNQPATIDLTKLSNPQVKMWDVYLDPAHPLWVGIEDPRAVFLDVWSTCTPPHGTPQAEHMSTVATLRNSN